MQVNLDKRRCIGSGNCALAADHIFGLSEEGIVELVREPGEDERQAVEDAVRACPTATISVID